MWVFFEQAQRDLRGEGFDPDAAKYRYEIEGEGNSVRIEHAGEPGAILVGLGKGSVVIVSAPGAVVRGLTVRGSGTDGQARWITPRAR